MTHANSERKHIVFFIPALNTGGAEKNTVLLANHFAGQGIRVEVLLIKKQGAFLDLVDPSVTVKELGGKGTLRSIMPLISYIRSARPDWLVANLPGPSVVALMARILARLNVKIALVQHHPFSHKADESRTLRGKIRSGLARILFQKADRVIAVSDGVAQDLRNATQVLSEKIHIIPNPFDTKKILSQASGPPQHPWLKNKTDPVMISVGRLNPPKDFETLLKSLKNCPELKCIICGEGPLENDLKSLSRDLGLDERVDFTGYCQNPYPLIANADLFVLSSKYEGFGNVLVESLLLGTPVISSNCPGGPWEILRHGKYGTLVPVGDVDKLSNAIKAQLKSFSPDKHKVEASKKYALQYDISFIADMYLKALA